MKLYVINHCNAWHEYSSFNLIGVVTKTNLKRALNKIKKECNYTKEDMETYIDINEVETNELDI